MSVPSNILKLIEANYSSDAAFESAAGLKPKTVYDWKRGKSSSYLKMLPQLSKILGASIDYLLENDEQKEKPATDSDRLTEEEKKIIDLLRKVPEEDRKMLVGMIEGALRSRGLLK